MLLLAVMVLGWALPYNVDPVDPQDPVQKPTAPVTDRVAVDSLGDIRGILGSQGKCIIVSDGGEAIAILYGAPSGDPNNPMKEKVAYSTDGGSSWVTFGPFSGNCRREYNAVDGAPDFNSVAGHLYFAWQENTQGYNDGALKVMIEENVPSAPSFSVPATMPNSQPPAMFPWEPDIAVAPDDPTNIVATAWSYLAGGNGWAYCWISNDGGYTWTDTIPMASITPDGSGSCGNLARGTGGYVIYTYQDWYLFTATDSTPYPYYMESTDGGFTWSAETPISGVPVNTGSQFWWTEMDAMIVNNQPWLCHGDIGTPGGGPYAIKGTGSPGSWTWTIYDAAVLGADSTNFGGEVWQCLPSQYPSLSYNATNGMVLCSYKANVLIGAGAVYNGAHIQGIYTLDDGANWSITDPLSTADNGSILWSDWSGTEVATHLVNFGNYGRTYAAWAQGAAAALLNFESEFVTPWGPPIGVEEVNGNLVGVYRFGVTPSVTSNICCATFTVPSATNVSLRVYDVSGRVVDNVFSGQAAGEQQINISTAQLANGTYFVVLETEQGNAAQKIVALH